MEADTARFNSVLRYRQLPGRLGALCGCGEEGERGETKAREGEDMKEVEESRKKWKQGKEKREQQIT